MQKKYQIFVSSTFRDLIEERQSVLEAILELNHIPCGMEAFPANNSTPFELIMRMIDDSDYYVLIIGGKYGSLSDDGISYTEMEYDYALKTNKNILCFIHSNPSELISKNVETKASILKKLEKFKAKASKHIVKHWNTKFELKSHVLSSLSIAFQLNPMPGWVKLKDEYQASFLKDLSDLQKRYNELQERYILLSENNRIDSESEIEKYSQKINIQYFIGNQYEEEHENTDLYEISFTPLELLFGTSEVILSVNSKLTLVAKFSELIFSIISGTEIYDDFLKKHDKYRLGSDCFHITDKSYKTIKILFVSFGWIDLDYIKRLVTSTRMKQSETINETWKLTSLGKKLILENFHNINIS